MNFETCGRASFESAQEQKVNPKLVNLLKIMNFQDPLAFNKLKCIPEKILQDLLPFFNKINIEHQDCMAVIQDKAKN